MKSPIILKRIGNLTTKFGGRTRGESVHPGLDIANRPGTPVPAFADGVVQSVGPTQNGMGNVIILKDNNGNTHQYGHLQSSLVKPGMKVKKGKPIAKMGKTGNVYSESGSDPTHLDVRIANAYNKFIDPTKFLNK